MAGFGKSDLARKGLREQYAGKPHAQVDLTSSDLSMSPNRKPTTAEARQELDRILAAIDEHAPGVATASDVVPEAGEQAEGEAAADTEPKAGP
jgi:hypothetical protein